MQKIQNYALIGNGRSSALISKEGSLDWLCWPKFDSPSLFASLLDPNKGGSWKIAPLSFQKIERNYIEGTNVLMTKFYTDTGKVILTDFMSLLPDEEKNKLLQPEEEIIRRVQCEEGEVELLIHFDPRPNFGSIIPKLRDKKSLGIRFKMGRALIIFRSSLKLDLKNNRIYTQIRLKAGQGIDFSLSHASESPSVITPMDKLISQKQELAINWWKNWSNQMKYDGPYKNEVNRSALALKILGFAPSGAFVAAPTTSLPERLGGELNWDYRFCWLRDGAFTVKALFGLGYREEAEAFVSWMLHSTRLTRPELRVLYDVYGNRSPKEYFLTQLRGYANSSPIRIGNRAKNFFQLDVYGEVIEAVCHLVREGDNLDLETQKMLSQFGKFVCQNWQKPDTGIWEEMDPLRHYTHSRLMSWVALDRLVELHKKRKIKNLPIDKIKEERQKIREAIEEKSWNNHLQSYVRSLEEEELDATVLVMPLYEFEKASSIRMQKTFQKIQERLVPTLGLVYRYEKSLREKEGVFGLCSFWLVEFLAKGGGSLEEAEQTFHQILKFANDVGLFSEEIDPKTGDALGNFPQAFTHVGLINAALALEKRKNQERNQTR